MNVLFLTLVQFNSIQERNIYTDLLREFVRNGHDVFVISPVEKRQNQKTCLIKETHATILRLQIGNTQKTNIIEKGISTILIESTFKKAIKQYFTDTKFDLILYSTPPITLVSAVKYVKKRDEAETYLLLKDIFPQNAIDIGILTKNGVKGLIYKHFRKKEKELYAISDHIGCMSSANVVYIKKNNPTINSKTVEICPNSIEVIDKSVEGETREAIRRKYSIPLDKTVFVYGGNLGKPQGIPFVIECLKKCETTKNVYFLVVGDGTEYHYVQEYIEKNKPKNVKLMRRLPKEDYDAMVGACDIGLIFLDHRFTIPNFPSRLLSYMQAKMPVLACTDPNTDLGKVIISGRFGWWCESNDAEAFAEAVKKIVNESYADKGTAAFEYLNRNFTSLRTYEIIVRTISKKV